MGRHSSIFLLLFFSSLVIVTGDVMNAVTNALQEATKQLILTDQQAKDLLPIILFHLQTNQSDAGQSSTINRIFSTLQSQLTLLNVLYYSGGVVVAIGMIVFLGMGINRWRGWGILACASVYSAAFAILGIELSKSPETQVASSIMCTLSVMMTCIQVHGFEKQIRFWPVNASPNRKHYIPMEIATVIVGLTWIYFHPDPLLMLPISGALYGISVHALPKTPEQPHVQKWFGMGMGTCMLGIAYAIDLQYASSFAFWMYSFGSLSLITGMGRRRNLLEDPFILMFYYTVNLLQYIFGLYTDQAVPLLVGAVGAIYCFVAFNSDTPTFSIFRRMSFFGLFYLGSNYLDKGEAVTLCFVTFLLFFSMFMSTLSHPPINDHRIRLILNMLLMWCMGDWINQTIQSIPIFQYAILLTIVIDSVHACRFAVVDPYLRLCLCNGVLLTCASLSLTPLAFLYQHNLRMVADITFFFCIIASIADLETLHVDIKKTIRGPLWFLIFSFGIVLVIYSHVTLQSHYYQASLTLLFISLYFLPTSNSPWKFLFLLGNVSVILLSLVIDGQLLTLVGGIGIFILISHLSLVFRNSMLFPFILSVVGLLLIYGGLQIQKYHTHLHEVAEKFLPTVEPLSQMVVAALVEFAILAIFSFRGIRNLAGKQSFIDIKNLGAPIFQVEKARLYYDPYLKMDISGSIQPHQIPNQITAVEGHVQSGRFWTILSQSYGHTRISILKMTAYPMSLYPTLFKLNVVGNQFTATLETTAIVKGALKKLAAKGDPQFSLYFVYRDRAHRVGVLFEMKTKASQLINTTGEIDTSVFNSDSKLQ
eukprot:TRINITY_DN5267_c0_g1_i5.p1 TRINITY_DN5267_c0_g1~~TRINITY_DN5267_c0_g1_i5.p1  ORF type:complete len:825 (-),score=158.61 TRINITY_DN5267_c0_g1_i5:12-2465(-)